MATAATAAVEAAAAEEWLTLDEVAERMRFPNRRALLFYLRRNPAPVFQRIGSQRYFMRARDVDRIMAPIDLTVARRRFGGGAEDNDPSQFVQISGPDAEAPGRPPGRRAPAPRRSKPAGGRSRRVAPPDAR